LETTSKKAEDNKQAITVTLTSDEVQQEIDEVYKQAGKNRIAGFRPGKAPRKILENHFGGKEYFLAQATEELVQTYTPLALNEHNLIPMSGPDFDKLDMAGEGESFVFSFSVEVPPVLELSSYDPIKIELPSTEATDEELQQQIDVLLSYHATTDEEGNEQLPELTDAWVKEVLEFESVEELKERMSVAVGAQKSQQIASIREMLITQELSKRLAGEVPEALVKQTEQDNYRELFQNLQKQRTTLDAYLEMIDLTPESFREDMRAQAEESAAVALALDALALHLEFTATDDEVMEEFEKSGAGDSAKIYESWKINGRLPEIRQGITRMKASKHVFDNVEVFDIGTLYPQDSEAEVTDDAAEKPKKAKKSTSAQKESSPKDKTAKADSKNGKEDE